MNDRHGRLTQLPTVKSKLLKRGVTLKGPPTVLRKLSKTEVLYYLRTEPFGLLPSTF